jgi:hypothetical protein
METHHKGLIYYINHQLKLHKTNNISIHTGEITKDLEKSLKKHFKVTKELWGYTKFEKKV